MLYFNLFCLVAYILIYLLEVFSFLRKDRKGTNLQERLGGEELKSNGRENYFQNVVDE